MDLKQMLICILFLLFTSPPGLCSSDYTEDSSDDEIARVRVPSARIKIYTDESRSLQLGLPIWQSLHAKENYFSTRAMDLIEYDNIKNYDIVIIQNQVESLSYSNQEIEALTRFVQEGGGLLVVGNVAPHLKDRADFQKGRLVNPAPLPADSFATNQIGRIFHVAFTNASRVEIPQFNPGILNQNVNLKLLAFKQPLTPILCDKNTHAVPLAEAFGYPVAAAVSFGKGQAIFVGAPRLFMEHGSLPDRKLGKTDDIIETQKQLLNRWLLWLAEGKHSQNTEKQTYPTDIYPRGRIETENAQFFFIPPLQPQAEKLAADWKLIWADFSSYLGIKHPLEFVKDFEPGQKLTVLVRASTAGGQSGGHRVTVPVMGESWRAVSVLSHEVGHKLLGGETTGMSEGSAEWFSCRGLRAAGYRDRAQEKYTEHISDFRALDPSGNTLNIADKLTDIKQGKACLGKWIWILDQLETRYGGDFLKRYLVQLRTQYQLAGSHRRYVDAQHPREKITLDETVSVMSRSAGEDLVPWFQKLGITVHEISEKRPSEK